jgi:hypothetical protein
MMPPLRPWTLLLAATLLAGCAKQPVAARDWSNEYDYGEGCAEARRQAHDSIAPGRVGPNLREIPIPPMPVPPRVKGSKATIEMSVDSAGRPVPATLKVRGLSDAAYARDLRALLLNTLQFRPAYIGRCAVAGRYTLTYDF